MMVGGFSADTIKFSQICRSPIPNYTQEDLAWAKGFATTIERKQNLLALVLYKKSLQEDGVLRSARIQIASEYIKSGVTTTDDPSEPAQAELRNFLPGMLAVINSTDVERFRPYWNKWQALNRYSLTGDANLVGIAIAYWYRLCSQYGVRVALNLFQLFEGGIPEYIPNNFEKKEGLKSYFVQCCALRLPHEPLAIQSAKELPEAELMQVMRFCLTGFPTEEEMYEQYFNSAHPELDFLLTVLEEHLQQHELADKLPDKDMRARMLLSILADNIKEAPSTASAERRPRIATVVHRPATEAEESKTTGGENNLLSRLGQAVNKGVSILSAGEGGVQREGGARGISKTTPESVRSKRTLRIAVQHAKLADVPEVLGSPTKRRAGAANTRSASNAEGAEERGEQPLNSPASIAKMEWQFDDADEAWRAVDFKPEPDQQYVAFFRGQHWLRSRLVANEVKSSEESEFQTAALERLERVKQAPDGALLSPLLATIEDADERQRRYQQLLVWNQELRNRGPVVRGSFVYPTQCHYVHTYFSNDYSRFLQGLNSQGARVGFAEDAVRDKAEIDDSVRDGDAIDPRQFNTAAQSVSPSFEMSDHPFFSFAESDPLHSLLYAYGSKAASKKMREDRLRPDYRADLTPKNPVVGEVYVLVIPFKTLSQLPHMDVWTEYAQGRMHVDSRIVSERETTFIGQVDSEYVVLKIPVKWPSFDRYDDSYWRLFGLDEKRWGEFKVQCEKAVALKQTGDRLLYRQFKRALSDFLIGHIRCRLQFHVKELLQGQQFYRDPSGLLWQVPSERKVLVLLRTLSMQRTEMQNALRVANAQTDFQGLSDDDCAACQPLIKLLVNQDFLQLYQEIQVRLAYQDKLLLDRELVSLLQDLKGFLEKYLNRPGTIKKWLRDSQDHLAAMANRSAEVHGNHARPQGSLAAPAPIGDSEPAAREALPLPAHELSDEEKRTLANVHTVVVLDPQELAFKSRYAQQLLQIVREGTYEELVNFHGQLRVLLPHKETFDKCWSELIVIKDTEGLSVLHWLAKREVDVPRMFDILRNGQHFKMVEQDSSGKQPLHYAAANGRVGLMARMLRHQAKFSPNAADNVGKTPLHYAIGAGSTSVVMLLLQERADLLLKDKSGKRPCEYWPDKTRRDYQFLQDLEALLLAMNPIIIAGGFPMVLPTLASRQRAVTAVVERLQGFARSYPEQWLQLKAAYYLETRVFMIRNVWHTLSTTLASWKQHRALAELGELEYSFHPLEMDKRNKSVRQASALTQALQACTRLTEKSRTAAVDTVAVILAQYADSSLATERPWEARLIRTALEGCRGLPAETMAKLKRLSQENLENHPVAQASFLQAPQGSTVAERGVAAGMAI